MLSSQSPTVGIAGAGVMGRVLAWRLQQAGFAVTLFDRDRRQQGDAAAYTAAGMLTPYCEVESAELAVYHLGMQSLPLWQQWQQDLGDLGYRDQGSLVLAHANDRADFNNFRRQLQGKLPKNPKDIDQSVHYHLLDQHALMQREPELASTFKDAIYLPLEAWLCPHKTLAALADNLLRSGAKWCEAMTVIHVANQQIITEQQTHHFDWVIDTRGLGGKSQWSELRGVRGELLWLQAPDVKIDHLVRLMHPRYRLYLVPKGWDDLYIVGATQIESNDRSPITVRSALELLSAAYSLHRGFAEARIVDIRTNCRPALNNNLPQIQQDGQTLRVNGLFRHGFLLAPIIAEQTVSRLVC